MNGALTLPFNLIYNRLKRGIEQWVIVKRGFFLHDLNFIYQKYLEIVFVPTYLSNVFHIPKKVFCPHLNPPPLVGEEKLWAIPLRVKKITAFLPLLGGRLVWGFKCVLTNIVSL